MVLSDSHYMAMAIEQAKKGIGRTSPNPAVGAVIVKGGEVLGMGYHKRAGTPHAEINALESAGPNVNGATIYVTLEPCSHTGRTPPCCEAIVKAGLAKVVVGMGDPNPLVSGRGIRYLQDNGVEVVTGVLTLECEELNYPFIKYITKQLPWVIMKAGISLDGRLNYSTGESGWITGEKTGVAVHRLRDQVDAIMVGVATVKIDNPSLTTRLPDKEGKDPVRIVVDSGLSAPLSSKIFHLKSKAPTWVVCSDAVSQDKIDGFEEAGVRVFPGRVGENGKIQMKDILYRLAEENISSILVEGGGSLHGSLLGEKLYDYACLFYGPLFAGDNGVPLVSGMAVSGRAEAPRILSPRIERYGEDVLVSGHLTY